MKRIDAVLSKDVLRNTDQLTLGFFEDEKLPRFTSALPKPLGQMLKDVFQKEGFKAQTGKSVSFYFQHTAGLIKILGLGLGKRGEINCEKVREAAGSAVLAARAQKFKTVSFFLESFLVPKSGVEKTAEVLAEASSLALYRFQGYKVSHNGGSGNGTRHPERVVIALSRKDQINAVKSGIRTGLALGEGVQIARDLINEPSNKMDPAIFAGRVQRLAKKFGLKVRILEKRELEKEKMGGLLAVGQGSVIPPRLVVLTYQGKKTGAPTCVVGKGVTFDTGGISIKPSKGMELMKYDMAGGAAVVGVLISAACLKLPVKLVGIVPLAENMPSGSAIKPGDVIHSAAGLSIEVVNTDAEGRLILADALHYAKRFKPKAVFDMATLTGAVSVVVGSRAMAAMGNSGLIHDLARAGEEVNERVWELPMWPEYDEDVKSEVADLQNVGKGEAGTIMGAKFLEPFVNKAYPWVHLDIASTAWVERKAPSYCPKGARGVAIRLLIQYFRTKV